MQNSDSEEVYSVSGLIAGKEEKLLPILQDAERTGSFAVSLHGETPAAGLCIALPGTAVEPGEDISVKASADSLYCIIKSRAAQFFTVVSGLVKTVSSRIRQTCRSVFRRVRDRRMPHPVLAGRAGGLRL